MADAPNPEARIHTREGTVDTPSGAVAWRATAGWLPLRDGPRERPRAEVFYTYYTAGEPAARPLTFVFNGGPGAASAYLHFGCLGPQRVLTRDDGSLLPAPARLVPNAETWLAFTDLVFVDPVGTGLSRGLPDEQEKEPPKEEDGHYWNVEADLASLGQFFERFLSEHRRWGSPIHLVGESYGGYRVARMVRTVQESVGIGLSGAFLVSPALEWEYLLGGRFELQSLLAVLPSMAASAFAHERAGQGRSAREFLAEVERFAIAELVPAIGGAALAGQPLDPATASRMAGLLGLPAQLVASRGGRIDLETFRRALLADRGEVVGLYDGSISAPDPLPNEPRYQGMDPTLAGQVRLFATAANAWLRDGLGVTDPRSYRLLSYDVNQKWNFARKDGMPFPVGGLADLAIGMASNPDLRVVIAHGVHDMITPYFSTDLQIGLLGHDSPVARRIERVRYDGGHMYYLRESSRRAFHADVARVYADGRSR